LEGRKTIQVTGIKKKGCRCGAEARKKTKKPLQEERQYEHQGDKVARSQ